MADLIIGLRGHISYVSFESCSMRGNVHSFRHPEVVRLERRYRWEQACWRCVILNHLDTLVMKVKGHAVKAQERESSRFPKGPLSNRRAPFSQSWRTRVGCGLTRPQGLRDVFGFRNSFITNIFIIRSFKLLCVTLATFPIPQTKTVFTITAGNKSILPFEISHQIISTPSPVDRNFESSTGTRVSWLFNGLQQLSHYQLPSFLTFKRRYNSLLKAIEKENNMASGGVSPAVSIRSETPELPGSNTPHGHSKLNNVLTNTTNMLPSETSISPKIKICVFCGASPGNSPAHMVFTYPSLLSSFAKFSTQIPKTLTEDENRNQPGL
jgi:hypothetical protein